MNKPKFLQNEKKYSGGYNHSISETLKWSYQLFLGPILFAILLGFMGRLALLFTANTIGYWVDTLCLSHATDTSFCRTVPFGLSQFSSDDFILLILALCLIGFGLTAVYRVMFSRLSAMAVSQLYDEVTFRTSRYPLSFFDSTPTGRIMTRFSSDYGNVFRLFGGPLAEFLAIIFDLISMVILITLAHPVFIGLVIFMAGANYLVYLFNREQLRIERRELSHSRSPSIAHFAETTQGASSIRTYLKEQTFFNRFKRLNDQFQNQKLKTVKKLMFFSFQMNSLSSILLLITGFLSYYLASENLISIGSIGVALTFVTFSGNTIQMFFEWLAQFEEAIIGVERLDEYLRLPIEAGSSLPLSAKFPTHHAKSNLAPPINRKIKLDSNASVQFSNVSFRYRQDLPWILKNITFEVKPGEKIGIVGKTGSGKSTLIQCLYYLYPIEKGLISINGEAPNLDDSNQKIQGISLDQYRSQIAFISQDPVLFKGTLRFNLTIGGSQSDEEICAALEKVGMRNWLLQRAGGLDMQIEERGRNVSQGERQLICMARCLLQNTPIVILDEATSNIDPHSESLLMNASEEYFEGKTQLIIAHRLSTLEKCDRILWIHEGEIKALGPTQEVLNKFKGININEVLKP